MIKECSELTKSESELVQGKNPRHRDWKADQNWKP